MNLDDAKLLIKLARDSISSFFTNKALNLRDTDKFSKKQGVFVTLNLLGRLRGCIGYLEPVLELQRAVIQAARSAAFKDPRFPPLRESELEDITIEISVLTVPKVIEVEKPKEYLDKIKIGKHGLKISITYEDMSGTSYSNSKIYEVSVFATESFLPTEYVIALVVIAVLAVIAYLVITVRFKK